MDNYLRIITYKTAYYTFYLPVACGLIMAGVTDAPALKLAQDVCIDMGQYFQVRSRGGEGEANWEKGRDRALGRREEVEGGRVDKQDGAGGVVWHKVCFLCERRRGVLKGGNDWGQGCRGRGRMRLAEKATCLKWAN